MVSIDLRGDQEVYIGGTYFPIEGRVRLTNISVTPNPIIFGDTSKQGDTQVMSQLIQTNPTGGSGVYKANPRTDTERFWTSKLETRFRNLLCLPPLTYDLGKPSALSSEDCLLSREFQAIQYFVFSGGKLYRWNDASATFGDGTATGGWSSEIADLAASPTDAIVFKSYLYFALETSIKKMTAGEVVSAGVGAASYFETWDEKLWRLYENSGIWTLGFTSDGGSSAESWTDGGTFPYGITPTQLTTFRNVVGDSVLAAITNVGLWLYDATNSKWRQTEIRIPPMPSGQLSRSCYFRDGKLYFTSGNMGLVSVQPGNPFIATPVGLDRDDGVPEEESGKISRIAADFNWVLALVDSTGITDDDTMYSGLGGPFDTPEWPTVQGATSLRAWDGGWHTVWSSPSDGNPGYFLEVSGAYSKRRVYWGAASKVYCQDLPSEVHNPRNNPNRKFAAGPYDHVTSWQDYGTDVQQKVQGHFYLRTTGCSADETVTVYYATDLDDDTWTQLGDPITENTVTELKPGGVAGLQCRMIRFRFRLQRGDDTSLTPRIEFWAADFMRLLPATYGFVVKLDLTKNHRNKTPAQMATALKELADAAQTSNFYQFAYQDDLQGSAQTYYGRITRLQGEEQAGASLRGQGYFMVSFMVPYLEDAE